MHNFDSSASSVLPQKQLEFIVKQREKCYNLAKLDT